MLISVYLNTIIFCFGVETGLCVGVCRDEQLSVFFSVSTNSK